MRRRVVVSVILAVALAARCAIVLDTPGYRPVNDSIHYVRLSESVAATGDYGSPPTAYHPPGYPYLLAGLQLVAGREGTHAVAARLFQALLGTLAVALIGLLAASLLGRRAGLLALAVAAVYLPLIELGDTLMSENLFVVLELGALLAALRARGSPHALRWAALSGALTGLAALTRENGLLLALPLALCVWSARPRGSLAALRAPALLIAATLLVIAPWTLRNAIVMHSFIPISDETGMTLAGTYNAASAHDRRDPYAWRDLFRIPQDATLVREQSSVSETAFESRLQSAAIDYVGAHPLAIVEVAYWNTRRLLDLAGSFATESAASNIGLPTGLARRGAEWFWLTAALALAGLFAPATRRLPRWLWLAVGLLFASVVLVQGETPRFRAPLDPFLIVLAAVGVDVLLRRTAQVAARLASDAEPARTGDLSLPPPAPGQPG